VAGARAVKNEFRQILACPQKGEVLARIRRRRPRQAVNALISRFYDSEAVIRWRAIDAAGILVADLAGSEPESARVLMRRFMWMLNDESGGIGWGAPEALGAAMAQSTMMAAEYAGILCSYIDPKQNFLEHLGLQRGVLWGLGRLARSAPGRVKSAATHISLFFKSEDPYHRGLSAWAAGNIGAPVCLDPLGALTADETMIEFFQHWQLRDISVADFARQAAAKISRAQKEG
jgi:HEAT repeat protein